MTFTLYNDDCLNTLKNLEDNSIDSCVTDPPYGLSFMGKSWDYDVPQKEVWQEVLRVLKPGGHLLAFFGSRTYHRGVIQIEDAGFEVRDQIMWLYGSGFPKSHNIGNGWGTALKPAHEPIVVARKPISQTVAKNVLEYGTGALNIDECRTKEKGMKWEKPRGGIWKTDTEAKSKLVENDLGRWPANVIHDGSDEVVSVFPDTGKSGVAVQKNGGGQKIGGKSGIYGGSNGLLREDVGYNDSGSAARFFYSAKASKTDRDEGLDMLPDKQNCGSYQFRTDSSLDGKSTKDRKNNHPTVKPTELMKYLCRLVTPKSGIVLDPFMGSGSTGKAALQEGFRFVGIEMNKEYYDIAEARIQHVANSKEVSLESFFT